MMGSVAVYVGLLATLVAAVSLVRPVALLRVRTRKAALGLGGVGLALVAVGMMLPTGVRNAATTESLLDEWMPQWQFGEVHSLPVRATIQRAWQAVHEVTGDEIALMRTLMWLRHPRWPWGERQPEDAGWERPIVEVATAGGFHVLARSAESQEWRELVLGTVLLGDGATQPPVESADAWRQSLLGRPGNTVAAINFRVQDEGGGWVRVTTETRVAATDASTRRRFTRYWRLIYPGRRLLRHTWLRAIRKRAELDVDTHTAGVRASLLYAVSSGAPGKWQPTQTEIFALDPESQASRPVFSDAGEGFLLLPPLRSGIPGTLLVTNGTRVFGFGRTRGGGQADDAGALYEISTDGSNRAREVCRVLGQQRAPRNVFVSPLGDKIGYINDIRARWVLFIHETTGGRLLHEIPLEPILLDGFVRTIGWMPDNERIFLTGEIGDVHVTSEESYPRAGSYVMREDGGDVQPVPDAVDGATVRQGFRALDDTPPSMLGVLPDGRYLFAELQFGSGGRTPRTFYYAADPVTGTRADLPGSGDVLASSSFYWSKLSPRDGRMLAFSAVDPDGEVVWVLDLHTGASTRVMTHPAEPLGFPYLTIIGWYEH